jgi:hypothetical protein
VYTARLVAVRTSTVVTIGMVLLSAGGVAAIFGESIIAVLSPPEPPAMAAPAATAVAPAAPPRAPAPGGTDGGVPGGG